MSQVHYFSKTNYCFISKKNKP